MVEGKYICCRNCGAIHHVTSFDRVPIYQFESSEIQEIPVNDWRDFMNQHAGHKLEPLTATGKDYFSSGAADPMGLAYIETSNGDETLLIRRSRPSIQEPIRYEIVRGRLVENGFSLEVQEKEIRKEMKLHFSWAPATPLDDKKINLFIALFRELVSELDPKNVRTQEFSSSEDNISYGQLDSSIVEALMNRCTACFLPIELASIRRFVESHCEACDVMALVKRRAVTVEQRVE